MKFICRLTEIGALALVIIISKVLCQCGNGAIDAGEACDDGNAVISDGCTNCNIDTGYTCAGAPSVCANTYHCGDGVLEAGEACDDGNLLSNDGCENTCQLTPGWTCNTASPNVCTEVCGDGYDFGKLGCDDNNTLYLDGCSETCTVDADFQCGGGTSSNPDDCFEINGDGRDYGWFACDDGNKSPNCDGCDRDGNILPGYLCNAGTPTNPDRCWTECGDGLRVCAEACDDGNKNPGDGCSDACVVEAGYTCDGGNFWRADYCYEICGDGLDIGFYDCDDGNLVNGDGCDDSCVIELGYTCTGGTAASADTCTEICGDGIDLFNYPCDDGNLVNGDGCDATCNIEPGWDCQYGTRDWHDECWHWHNNPAIVGYEINNESMVSLYFNASVEIPTDWNDFIDIKIEIHGPRTEQNYYLTRYFSLRNKTTALMAPNHSKVWNIDIAYSPHIQFLGDGVENITITITDRRRVTHNQYGFVLINNKAYAKLEHPTENDRSCGMEGWWKVAYWLYISLVINNFSFFLLGASLWHTIGITMSLQMIIYYPMMHNYPPSCLSRFFQDFQVTIGKMEWFNIQEFVLGTKPEDLVKDGSTNYRFERQNFVRYNMLYNAVEVIFIWVIALIACVAVFLLRILCLNNSLIASYEKRFRWEITVKGFILVYQHVMTCCLLNIRHPQGSPKIYATATALSNIIFITFLVLYALMAILLLYFKTLGPKAKSKWFCKGLLRDIDTSHISKYMYYLVYLLKKTIFAFTFAFAHDWGLVPYNITAVFVIFFPLMYLIYARPFSHRLTNIHMIYNELNEMLITSMYFNYFDPHLTDWEFYMYARITVIDIAIWVVVSYIIFLLSLPRFCKIKCPKRKPKIYLPDYEEEIQQELDSPISSEHDFIIEAAHVDVKEANRRLDSFSSDDKEEGEREVLDDDLDEDLEDLERDDNAEL